MSKIDTNLDVSKGKISVIIPVYKVEQFMDRCVESILNQTYENFEVILVDDGSPDNSGKICDKWANKDERIRVFHKENSGVSDTRNLGLKNAIGEFVYFMDSDDFLENNAFEICIQKMQPDVDMVVFGYNQVASETNSKQIFPKAMEYTDESVSDYVRDTNMAVCFASVWTKLYRRELCIGVNFKKGLQFGEDFLFNVDIAKKCKKIITIEDCLYNYVIFENQNSITKENNRQRVVDCYNSQYQVLRDWLGDLDWINARYVYSFFYYIRSYVKISNESKDEKLKFISEILDSEKFKYALKHSKMLGLKRKIAKFVVSRKNQNFRYLLFKLI